MYVENSKRIDINQFKEYLNGSYYSVSLPQYWKCNGEPAGSISLWIKEDNSARKYFYLEYTVTNNYNGKKNDISYNIYTLKTNCNYGGKRFWFICPNANCGRKCSKLYFRDSYFVCLKCSRLLYYNQKCSRKYREISYSHMDDDANKLENQLRKKYYRGLPTRRYKRVLQLHARARYGENLVREQIIQLAARISPEMKDLVNRRDLIRKSLGIK